MKLPILLGSLLTIVFTSSVYAQNTKRRLVPRKTVSYSYSESRPVGQERMSYDADLAPAPKFYLEPTVGYSSANLMGIQGQNGASVEGVTGYRAGVSALYGKSALQLESGLFYSQSGAAFKNLNLTYPITYTGTVDLKYLEIPLLARYSFQDPKESHIFIHGGAVVGLLQSAQYKISDIKNYSGYIGQTERNLKDEINAFDARLLLGVGGAYNITRSIALLVSLDYQYGVTKVNSKSFFADVDVYNSTLNGNLGVSFGI